MYSKLFVAAVVILCSFDVTYALMCYSCTFPNSNCGETIGNDTGIDRISCTGSCATTKSTTTIQGIEITGYNRTCLEFCPALTCRNFSSGDGTNARACIHCCNNTDLCNGNNEFESPTDKPTTDGDNRLMCYNCTYPDDPDCGETIGDPMNIDKVSCTGGCATINKTSSSNVTSYKRTCFREAVCPQNRNCSEVDDERSCVECCNTDLCNGNFESEPTNQSGPAPTDQSPTKDPNAGSRDIASIVIVLLTLWLYTTLV
ncbi:uncharacterized protein LOC117123278 isoform X3 [Anneissia japonica]|nr:uncharacterized protein LOC117123278 isoform X3 [Anneissia japonica]XP_033125029.1 uncharacterized protein LOC117123278 isoform X3 [Anneissia japonica]XP_033125031.1 uncharacterized protein LOC117123278 isoform X3 [Anneissia japonica]XP_033125032.1 uncharacterized protein LOC117123278 isoform X3 [Anneissia japonica]XP_033125033.1 uncharacterized protein LOC117123278 isoform X3 [Anneissia japonica]